MLMQSPSPFLLPGKRIAHKWKPYIGDDVIKVLKTDTIQNSAAQSLQLGISGLQLGISGHQLGNNGLQMGIIGLLLLLQGLLLLLQGRKGNAELLK